MLENLNLGGNPSVVDILKRLLSDKDIELKTHLEIEQIQVLTQMTWFILNEIEPKKDPMLLQLETIHEYLKLMTSLNRKSRTEIVDAVSNMKKPEFKDSPIINDLKN